MCGLSICSTTIIIQYCMSGSTSDILIILYHLFMAYMQKFTGRHSKCLVDSSMQFWLLLQPLHTACNKVYNKKGAIKFSHSSTVLVVVSYYCWNNRNIEPAFVRRVDPPVTQHQYCCPLPLSATFFA